MKNFLKIVLSLMFVAFLFSCDSNSGTKVSKDQWEAGFNKLLALRSVDTTVDTSSEDGYILKYEMKFDKQTIKLEECIARSWETQKTSTGEMIGETDDEDGYFPAYFASKYVNNAWVAKVKDSSKGEWVDVVLEEDGEFENSTYAAIKNLVNTLKDEYSEEYYNEDEKTYIIPEIIVEDTSDEVGGTMSVEVKFNDDYTIKSIYSSAKTSDNITVETKIEFELKEKLSKPSWFSEAFPDNN